MALIRAIQERWRISPPEVIGSASLGITVLIFLFQLPSTTSSGLSYVVTNFFQHLYVVIWLLVITAYNRTVTIRTLLAFWFVGFYTVMVVTLLVGQPVAIIFGSSSPILDQMWVPMTEELLKALPVALYLYFLARRNRWQTAACDGLLLGFVVGAGFELHEAALYGRVDGSGWSATPFSFLFPTLNYYGGTYWPGHAVVTALVGLGLGLAFLLRKNLLVWALPTGAFSLAVLEHSYTNALAGIGPRDTAPLYVTIIQVPLLKGQLPIILIIVGIIATIVLEQRILRRSEKWDKMFSSLPLGEILSLVEFPMTRKKLARFATALDYLRYRRSAYYAVWHWRKGRNVPEQAADEFVVTLNMLRGKARPS